MAEILGILDQLKINSTLFIQFGIVIVMFILTKLIFFSKLQFVIENREEKTVKLESSADETFQKVNELSESYKEKINEANVKAQTKLNTVRTDIINEEDKKYKQVEQEMEQYLDTSRKELVEEIKVKENQILSSSDELADALVEKITQ